MKYESLDVTTVRAKASLTDGTIEFETEDGHPVLCVSTSAGPRFLTASANPLSYTGQLADGDGLSGLDPGDDTLTEGDALLYAAYGVHLDRETGRTGDGRTVWLTVTTDGGGTDV
ncbi:hypothetical protein ACLUWO_05065 [Pseudoscardovia radai]|uniref:hypothetical protein n=1 Tax=Pseudoscardovia radai TaxID=987066 RepID=UPI003995D2BA